MLCTLEDKPQRFIWNNKLEKLYSKTVEKELRSIKWEHFDELQTTKIENINFEIENLLSSVEDKFINSAGNVLRKTRKHKESETKNRKIKYKKGLAKFVMTNIKS